MRQILYGKKRRTTGDCRRKTDYTTVLGLMGVFLLARSKMGIFPSGCFQNRIGECHGV